MNDVTSTVENLLELLVKTNRRQEVLLKHIHDRVGAVVDLLGELVEKAPCAEQERQAAEVISNAVEDSIRMVSQVIGGKQMPAELTETLKRLSLSANKRG